MTENKIRKHYNSLLPAYHFLGLSVVGDVSFLAWLAKEEKSLSKMNENACNFGRSKSGETRYETRCNDTIEAIEQAMPKLAGLVTINSDPRGAAIKITPYIDDENHDTKHGCHENPKHAELIRESGIGRDWGGYGMLAPQHQN